MGMGMGMGGEPGAGGQGSAAIVINWENFNFPPCLHLVHFSVGELQGSLRRYALFVYLSYTIMLSVLGLNRTSINPC